MSSDNDANQEEYEKGREARQDAALVQLRQQCNDLLLGHEALLQLIHQLTDRVADLEEKLAEEPKQRDTDDF